MQVWAVGEFCSSTCNEESTADRIAKFYEALEVVSYEVSSMVVTVHSESAPFSVKIISVLMSAIAKVCSVIFSNRFISL